VYECLVSSNLNEWKTGLLNGAPTSVFARDELWNKLRLRELELPEKEEEQQQQQQQQQEEGEKQHNEGEEAKK
jgi:hypothetical protein